MIRTRGSVISASPACGPPGLFENPGQRHATADGGARVRLEDYGVSQGQRRRDRADSQDLREVERRDHADDPGGDPLGEAEARLLAGDQLAIGPGRQRGRLVDLPGRDVRLELGRRGYLPAFPDAPWLDFP